VKFKEEYKDGDFKEVRKFAWKPTVVRKKYGGQERVTVWLEYYSRQYYYDSRNGEWVHDDDCAIYDYAGC
jgi:hypothetical protein